MSNAFRESQTHTFRNQVVFVTGFGVIADQPFQIGSENTTNSLVITYNQIVPLGGISGYDTHISTGDADARYVNITGNETVDGKKTFSDITYIDKIESIINKEEAGPRIYVNSGLLYDWNGSLIANWSDGLLLSNPTTTSLDWKNRILSGDWNILGTIRISGNSVATGESAQGDFVTNTEFLQYSGAADNRYVNITGNETINGNKTFNDIVYIDKIESLANQEEAGPRVYVDAAELYDINGSLIANWSNGTLLSNSVTTSLDWKNRILSGNWNILGSLRMSGVSVSTGSNGVDDNRWKANNSDIFYTYGSGANAISGSGCVGIGTAPRFGASLHIRTPFSGSVGLSHTGILVQRGWGWPQSNAYISCINENNSVEFKVDGWGRVWVPSFLYVGFPASINFSTTIPLTLTGSNTTLGDFYTDAVNQPQSLFRFRSRGSQFMYFGINYTGNTTKYIYLNGNADSKNPMLVIDSNLDGQGNVGINNNFPIEKLDVSGNILASGIKANHLLTISGNPVLTGNNSDFITTGIYYRPTQLYSGFNPIVIDWSSGNCFKYMLTGNVNFSFSNNRDGQTIVVMVANTGNKNFSGIWPSNIHWSNNTIPTQTSGSKADIYTFINIFTGIYGSVVQNFWN